MNYMVVLSFNGGNEVVYIGDDQHQALAVAQDNCVTGEVKILQLGLYDGWEAVYVHMQTVEHRPEARG